MCRDEGVGVVDGAGSSAGLLEGTVVEQLLEVAVQAVHELWEFDRVNDEGLGEGALLREAGRLHQRLGV